MGFKVMCIMIMADVSVLLCVNGGFSCWAVFMGVFWVFIGYLLGAFIGFFIIFLDIYKAPILCRLWVWF